MARLTFFFSISEPQKKLNIHRIDVTIAYPPGVYHLKSPDGSIPDVTRIVGAIQNRITPGCSIHDIAGAVNEDILALFPRCRLVNTGYLPLVPETARVDGLTGRVCTYVTPNPRERSRDVDLPGPRYALSSQWEFPNVRKPGRTGPIFGLKTVEHGSSPVHDVQSDLSDNAPGLDLGQVHPTFSIFQEIAESAKHLLRSSREESVLDLARLTYRLADQQSPCKRLEEVTVSLRGSRSSKKPTLKVVLKLTRAQYEQSQQSFMAYSPKSGRARAFVALGSNLGNRIDMIESACREMSDGGTEVIRTSALYETKPMYLEDQNHFVNGACEVSSNVKNGFAYAERPTLQISTTLGPMELLDQLKTIEAKLGREKTIENGPRTIDLDILMYGNEVMESERLAIPHKRMLEREFVLRPLCE